MISKSFHGFLWESCHFGDKTLWVPSTQSFTIVEIIPTALESLLISSFLNSVFEVWLYGSISIGSLFIGFALTFGFVDRDVLDFRSRFFEPEIVFVSDDLFALSPDDFLSCTFAEFSYI